MHTILSLHDCHFDLEGDGFTRRADDFVAVMERVLASLASMEPGALKERHAESLRDGDGAMAIALANLADQACLDVLRARGWRDPAGASVSLSARLTA